MIECFVGFIGGGKSYNAVLRMLDHMSRGGCVVTNMRLELEPWFNDNCTFRGKNKSWHVGETCVNALGVRRVLHDYYRWEYQQGQYRYVSDDDLLEHGLAGKLPGNRSGMPVLVVWDESADFWDCDNRQKADREFLSVLRHSRKLGMDFIFIVQDLSELNKRIRNQTQYVTRFFDMENFVVPGIGMNLGKIPGVGRQIRVLRYWRTDFEKGEYPEPVKRAWVVKNQCVFGCFRTDDMHMSLPVDVGSNTDFRGVGSVKRNVTWKQRICGYIYGVAIGVIGLILSGIV